MGKLGIHSKPRSFMFPQITMTPNRVSWLKGPSWSTVKMHGLALAYEGK